MKLHRILRTLACAATIAAIGASATANAAGAAMSPQQAQYLRLHETALAFVESIAKTADRYGQFQNVNLDQVRALIGLSEQAAQRNDYDQASLHSKAAYELLRSSIMESVAKSQAAAAAKTQ